MVVRAKVAGIDSPEALAQALTSAFYLADDGLATAPIWRWPWVSHCCWKARRVWARPRPPRPSPACSAAA